MIKIMKSPLTFYLLAISYAYFLLLSLSIKFLKNELFVVYFQLHSIQAETTMVLDNTREAVISHSTQQGIKFFNQAGHRILDDIVKQMAPDEQDGIRKELDEIKKRQSDLKQNAPVPAESRELHDSLFDLQIFQDFQRDGQEVEADKQKRYSLQELMQLPEEEIQNAVFSLVLINARSKYVSVKVSSLKLHLSSFKVINILDQTVSIMFSKSKGEKKILQLINACVSHQLRNPINTILIANLKFRNDTAMLLELVVGLNINEAQGN